ncbi:MAG: alpha/beta hydrolase [Candidatus Hodarchaeota archaeon]
MNNIIYIHGLQSSGEGFKGRLFQREISDILTPTFHEFDADISIQSLLNKRMEQLISILDKKGKWVIIGSSFGGLMGVLYTLSHPDKIIKLILLAPFLNNKFLNPDNFKFCSVPVIVYHGKNDQIIPYKHSIKRAKELFTNLKYNLVDDDHLLHNTVQSIDWKKLVECLI